MEQTLASALAVLTDMQRQAVDWADGALLVLAGPGSGKTQVLTCRIARLLESSPDENYRILALTFTNKAADEMRSRVASFVPGSDDRVNVGTFHGFCAQILRQHGVHIGVSPDYTIYSSIDDRRAIFEDAITRASTLGQPVTTSDVQYLDMIDRLKSNLVAVGQAAARLSPRPNADHIAVLYNLYEQELRNLNSLDFNSLILEAYSLVSQFPAIAASYRRSYPYWLVDEYQDTNVAQYSLIQALAGEGFRNIVAVADDDQIIYGWNGASFKRIQSFVSNYEAQVIQLPTNYRCPAAVVEAANRIVSYNSQRTQGKLPSIAGKTVTAYPTSEHIQLRVFDTDEDEAAGIADEIAQRGKDQWGETAVLARTNALLQTVTAQMKARGVPAATAQRRDEFVSASFRWLNALLKQAVRPLDRRNLATAIEAFNKLTSCEISPDQVISDAQVSGQGFMQTWLEFIHVCEHVSPEYLKLAECAVEISTDPKRARAITETIATEFGNMVEAHPDDVDLAEDMSAWKQLSREISDQIGKSAPLDQFLQELQLRSKEPIPPPNTVALMTIHAAKGREFDFVYLIGLAEDVLPSYQSKQKGNAGREMEEERRSCFVAITRTKECLILSRAEKYRGWTKAPSKFLVEMGLA